MATMVMFFFFFTIPITPQLRGKGVRHVTTHEKVVALTYDDGPQPKFTEALLEALKKHATPATFFLIGKRAHKHQALVERIWKDGHELGNHSWSHSILIGRTQRFIRKEIDDTDAAIKASGYDKEIHFRAPHGFKFWYLPKVLSSIQRTHILFDVVAWDWLSPGRDAIVKKVLKHVRPGSIILMHDGVGNKKDTIAASEIIIQTLKDQGYRFATISELLSLQQARPLKETASI